MSSLRHTATPAAEARHATDPRGPDLGASALLAGPALLTLVLVLHHPVLPPGPPEAPGGGRAMADVAAGLARLGPALEWVHGALLVLLAAQTLGFSRFAARLGWDRLPAAAGFLAYAAGALLLVVPALLDGFVTPTLAAECVRAAEAALHQQAVRECGPADLATLRLVAVMIQVFTKAGLLLLSGAAGAWAVALFAGAIPGAGDAGGPRLRRAVGVLGLACAAAPALVLLGTGVWLRPGNLAGLLAAQSVWACGVAALMARGDLPRAMPEANTGAEPRAAVA